MTDNKKTPSGGMVMRRRERRGHGRIPHTLRVTVKTNDTAEPLVTQNINRNGMFILTEHPAKRRDMIQLEAELGEHGTLESVAVVCHVVLPNEGNSVNLTPGMGVQLYGLSPSDNKRWETYVKQAGDELRHDARNAADVGVDPTVMAAQTQEQYDRSGVPSTVVTVEEETAPIHQLAFNVEDESSTSRGRPEFAVEFPTTDLLCEFQQRDLALGGFFLVTNNLLGVGTPIAVRIVHPATGEPFYLDCEVIRSGTEDRRGRPGLSVRFVDLTDETRRYFDEFVRVGAVEVELDLDDFSVD